LLPEFFNPAGMIHAGLVLDGYGAIGDHVRLAEIADPFPGPDGVGIEIHAASLNPIDFKIVHGDLKRISKYQLPRRFGFAGRAHLSQGVAGAA
jgi:NADPH:quinone reductase-like Zn-dependent oxidoreductase